MGLSPNNTDTESDDDVEPDKLVEKYISLQTRLYKLQPDLVQRGNKKPPNIKSTTKGDHGSNATSRLEATRVLGKMNVIDSDILFDRDEANRRWALVQNDLTKEAAERKKFQLDNEARSADLPNAYGSLESGPHAGTVSTSALSEEDPMDMVGGLFSTIPESATDAETRATNITSIVPEHTSIVLRDFGKWTGLSPRRILEEACKARYGVPSDRSQYG